MKIKSAVLLHHNELPLINSIESTKLNNEYFKKFFDDDYFENSLNMNFVVCNNAQIIFSNFSNFESYYLSQVGKNRNKDGYKIFFRMLTDN